MYTLVHNKIAVHTQLSAVCSLFVNSTRIVKSTEAPSADARLNQAPSARAHLQRVSHSQVVTSTRPFDPA